MRHRAIAAAIAVLGTACTAVAGPATTAAPTTSSSTTTTVAVTTTATSPEPTAVFEIGAAANHLNGTQLRFDRVEVFEDTTVVAIGISNGSRFELDLTRGRTELLAGEGTSIALSEPFDPGGIPRGEDRDLVLTFGPLPEGTDRVTLSLNQGGGASPNDDDTNAPSFTIGPEPLDARRSRPVLPDPAFLDRTAVSPTGVEAHLAGIAYTDTRIGVRVTFSNRSTKDVAISPDAAPNYLADDQRNIYFLTPPVDRAFLTIPAGSARTGVLVYAGRVDPAATSLQLGVNDDRSGVAADEFPRMVFTDIPVTGDTAITLTVPAAIQPGVTIDHPSEVSVTLDSIVFTTSAIRAAVRVTNPTAQAIALNATPSFAIDDVGAVAVLQPPADDPQLVVGANSTLTATLVFAGRPDSAASSLQVRLNPGRSTSAQDTQTPGFDFGPFDLVPGDTPEAPPEATVFAVGLRSELVDTELVSTEIQEVATILQQFNATPVEGGFRLTLPDDILFDFNQSTLRPDAIQALTLITQVLEYFEDDEVLVIGHTDSIGGSSYNQRLSLARAQSVVDDLVDTHGIAPSRLQAEGRGSTEPVSPNTNPDGSDNPAGRQANRRVEIIVLTTKALPGR